MTVTAVACSGPGNDGRHEPPLELREQIPWVNGIHPMIDDHNNDSVIMSDVPVYPNIAGGLEDPGSTDDPIRRGCDAASRVQFAEAWIETFEGRDHYLPAGLAWAGYDDASANSFRTPGFFNWYQGFKAYFPTPTDPPPAEPHFLSGTFGLPAAGIDDGPRCNGEENLNALHFKGGRFNRFGAGIDHALALAAGDECPLNSDGSQSDLCPPQGSRAERLAAAGLPETAFNDDGDPRPYVQPHVFWDVSNYDGIAFWARRGPEGQSTMLVKVQDKFTSDDLARENETFCRRLRPCDSRCLNHAPCQQDDQGIYRCFEGDAASYPGRGIEDVRLPMDDGLEDLVFPRCGESACTSPGTFADVDFTHATCEPHTFPSNHESGEFCVNPGEEPAPPEERCGDGPGKTVLLTTDWQFYTIPFSELRQLNFAKTSPYLDLKSIAMLSFIFTVGWVDVYLDNVTFYRNKE